MRKTALGIVALFCLAVAASAGGNEEYAIANIPAPLLKNAAVVKRAELMRYEITGKTSARFYRKVAYTILNDQGERWADCAVMYDKLRSIESFDGALFDAAGKKIKNLKKGDIKDESGMDDASLADDNRYKWYSFYYKVYPYTVEYEVEVKFKGSMFTPDWIPQERPRMSVQRSSLVVVSPADNPVHYKMFNYKTEPVVTTDKNSKLYNWEIKDVPTVEPEYASPAWHEITTSVYLATERISLDDYEGSNASWKDFGKFIYDIKKDRDQLPDDIKQKVHALTDGLPSIKEKIAVLYQFMQQNTRYISIQLGIGGWQPFDAKFVASQRYGDCKALSNYMYSLLKEADIRSVYTLITGDEDDNDYLIPDLPSSQFNHVILFVPAGKDTTWLECTSQTLAAGYLGAFTSNRYAVAIEETGGTLVRTPRYGADENLQVRNIKAAIDESGNLAALIQTRYRAEQQDRLHDITTSLSKDKLIEFLKNKVELATYDIRDFQYRQEQTALPVINETLNLEADNYATVSGKRLFVLPNIISRSHRKLKMEGERKYEIVLGPAYRDIDSTEITIPAGYTVEALPPEVSLDTKFGKYISSIKVDATHITYYRLMEQQDGRFPATDYTAFARFLDTVYKTDHSRIVFVKSEEKKAF